MRYILVLITLAVTGCASTLPADFAYSADSDKALLVFDDSIARNSATLILTPADLETGQFTQMPAQITAGLLNRIDPVDGGRPVYVETLDPGIYVISGTRTFQGNGTTTRCYGLGTTAIELKAGQANVLAGRAIRIGNSLFTNVSPGIASTPTDAARRALAQMPGIDADLEIELVEPVASVRFDRGLRLVGPGCPGTSNFEIIGNQNEGK